MNIEEWDELVDCYDCGAAVAPSAQYAISIDLDEFICFDCAVVRGGVYDTIEDRWIVFPDVVTGIPDERWLTTLSG